MEEYKKIIENRKESILEELFEFLRVPSISVENVGIEEIVCKIEKKFQSMNALTKRLEIKDAYPFLYAELGEGDFTLLIFDHYDVQPTGDRNLWKSDPFEPEVRDGKIFARGVGDNKGNLMLRMQAIDLITELTGKLPIKIKWVIEGEEELGSPHLEELAREYGYLWNDADLCLWESGGVDENDCPVIVLGYKGISYLELSCVKGEKDLHSLNASFFESAVWRLIQALNLLRDTDGNLTVPELVNQIKEPTDEENELMKKEPFDPEKFLKIKGRKEYLGNKKEPFEILKRHYFGNTCNISGIWGGYTGQGIKSVLPNEATAKLDIRLVSNQDSKRVADTIKNYLCDNNFDDIQIRELTNEPVSRTDPNSPVMKYVISIIENSYNKDVSVKISSGGTGPAYYLSTQYNIPVFSVGALYPGVNAHAPNENIRLTDYFNALSATIDIFLKLADFKKDQK
ncbi:MAG: Succinyl-diaminopimelate desuccinylase [Firmicutes bacterium ADurb.Bin419]|nr:MAG: Succinyl-diaminopimelate desuccinylase [Firmicutes bacterium ADurb.Bin419]